MTSFTVTVAGKEYKLEPQDERLVTWAGEVPVCPDCGEQLTQFGEDTKHAPVRAVRSCVFEVQCDYCGWSTPMKESV